MRDINTILNCHFDGDLVRHLFADLFGHSGAYSFRNFLVGVHTMFLWDPGTLGNLDDVRNLNWDFTADVGAFGSAITSSKTSDVRLELTVSSVTSTTVVRHMGTDL